MAQCRRQAEGLQFKGHRGAQGLHELGGVGDHHEALGGGGDDLLAAVRRATSLDQPPVGRNLVGAVNGEIEAVDLVERLDVETQRAGGGFGARRRRNEAGLGPRRAIARSRNATVEPVPRPTRMPSFTSSPAASAASRFSSSMFMGQAAA
jgi:hypothetical protein